MIILKYGFEFGNDHSCISSGNSEAVKMFGGYIIRNDCLNISEELSLRLLSLCKEYQSSLNWDYPPDPSPWTQEKKCDFSRRARQAYCDLVLQIGNSYHVEYDVFIPE